MPPGSSSRRRPWDPPGLPLSLSLPLPFLSLPLHSSRQERRLAAQSRAPPRKPPERAPAPAPLPGHTRRRPKPAHQIGPAPPDAPRQPTPDAPRRTDAARAQDTCAPCTARPRQEPAHSKPSRKPKPKCRRPFLLRALWSSRQSFLSPHYLPFVMDTING
jgi:hypothetical protein